MRNINEELNPKKLTLKEKWRKYRIKRKLKKGIKKLEKAPARVKFLEVCKVLERRALSTKAHDFKYRKVGKKKSGRTLEYKQAQRLAQGIFSVTLAPPENWTKGMLIKVIHYANKYKKEQEEDYEKFKNRSEFSLWLENKKNWLIKIWRKIWSYS